MCQSENGPNVLAREKLMHATYSIFLLLFFYFALHLIGTHVP